MPARNLDQATLFDTAVREGKAAFAKAIEAAPGEHFYAFAFYSDNDVTGVYPAANTLESYRRAYQGPEDSEEGIYYKWAPAEWNLDFGQFGSGDLMNETTKLMYPPNSDYDAREPIDEWYTRKVATIKTLNNALFRIREDGVFAGRSDPAKLACFLNIGDAMDDEIELMFQDIIKDLDPGVVVEMRRLFQFKAQ
jgi:hypothetical protein